MAAGSVATTRQGVRTATVSELRRELTELVSGLTEIEEGVVIERHGRPVAALIPYPTFRLLQRLLIREDLV